jgi:RNA polymerase sigma-70 factor, ECF subfamily
LGGYFSVKFRTLDDSSIVERGKDVSSTVTTIEDSLVQSCVSGNVDAWRALHRRYFPVAHAFLRKLAAREVDLEDACEDAFVELFRRLPTFRGQSDLKTWLYRLCVAQVRRARNRLRIVRALRARLHGDLPAEPTIPAAMITHSPMSDRVTSALDRMNDGDRLVFVLYEFEGLIGQQIAAIADCPEATVWRRLDCARRVFRNTLGMTQSEAAGNE